MRASFHLCPIRLDYFVEQAPLLLPIMDLGESTKGRPMDQVTPRKIRLQEQQPFLQIGGEIQQVEDLRDARGSRLRYSAFLYRKRSLFQEGPNTAEFVF
jgi:hypothetical protein